MTFAAGPSDSDVCHLPNRECGQLVEFPERLPASCKPQYTAYILDNT